MKTIYLAHTTGADLALKDELDLLRSLLADLPGARACFSYPLFHEVDIFLGVLDQPSPELVALVLDAISDRKSSDRMVRLFAREGSRIPPEIAQALASERGRRSENSSLAYLYSRLPDPIIYRTIEDIVGCVENIVAREFQPCSVIRDVC